ncbi:CLASSICAL ARABINOGALACTAN PROTEIN 9-LIKE [Salix viminalis]|uniref:CLASSICAL ARABINOGALACTAN PROTEIN 9-LIKE n=1 Tax=Salix viminalis TaxID=40686 RepID=A0A9Q0UIZ5_SALVM|nr:CLASSICAL ARABINOGALACTAN PROTEIN 9-LIKE [Salix viminalis]
MEGLKVIKLMAALSTLMVISVNGQISTPCTMSMISSFTPCINFITGSTNGSPPTASCCGSFRSLMSTGMDCACLLLTANVPVQLPINRTLAISLPRACSVPVQCKASGTPLPAPGPVLLGPTLPPPAAPAAAPSSERVSKAVALAPAPESEMTLPSTLAPAPESEMTLPSALAPAPESEMTLPLTPASPPEEVEAPQTTEGIRPVLFPSSSHVSPPSFLLIFLAIMVAVKKFY